jgi:urease accessory protein
MPRSARYFAPFGPGGSHAFDETVGQRLLSLQHSTLVQSPTFRAAFRAAFRECARSCIPVLRFAQAHFATAGRRGDESAASGTRTKRRTMERTPRAGRRRHLPNGPVSRRGRRTRRTAFLLAESAGPRHVPCNAACTVACRVRFGHSFVGATPPKSMQVVAPEKCSAYRKGMSVAELSVLHSATWHAELDLAFARRGERTIIERRRHAGPLLVQRPFHPEADGTCHVYVLHPPGGIAGGDELAVAVEALPGASALLTTPAATKLYRTKGPAAKVAQGFTLRAGSSLEWLPQETIAFGGSSVSNETTVRLGAGAHYIGWEITCLGRPLSGDEFVVGSFRQCTEIWRDHELLLIDRTTAHAPSSAKSGAWGWAGRSVYGTLIATTASDELVTALRSKVSPKRPGDLFAVTTLPGVTLCRFLGSSAEQARGVFFPAWDIVRRHVLGKPACAPRIWTC